MFSQKLNKSTRWKLGARISMEVFKREFANRVTSRFGDVEWPRPTPDLKPPDFFSQGYLKTNIRDEVPSVNQSHMSVNS